MRRGVWRWWVALLGWCFIGLVQAADLQVAAFTDSPDPVAAGATVAYTVRVDNNAPDAAVNGRLRFELPPRTTFVSATPASQNCTLSGSEVLCLLGSVGGSATSDERTIVITLRALGPGPDTISPVATVSANNDNNAANDSQSATTTVVRGADLTLAKTGAPDPVVAGGTVTYTLTAANADGPNDATGIRIVDALPPSVQYVSASGSGWTCAKTGAEPGGTVTCRRAGPHAVGAAIPPVTVVGTVLATGGNVTNSATVEPVAINGVPAVEDPLPDNNTVTRSTSVLPGADVRIDQKSVVSAQPAVAGNTVTFRIQPRNGGPGAATNAVVTDVLPAGWSFVSATGTGWSCGAVGQAVSCTRASLPAGNNADITLVATAPPNATVGATGSVYTNTASITSSVADPNSGNNAASTSVSVLPDGADLAITKSKTPNPVAVGSNLRSEINVANNGPAPATGPLRVVERLSGETYLGTIAPSTGWTCTPNGAEVVCEHPNTGGLAFGASLPTLTLRTSATAADAAAGNEACTGGSVPAGATAAARPPLEGDPNPTNDCATASATSTTTRPDLAITKVTSTPAGGDKRVSDTEATVTYTLVVSNVSPGADAATGVRIRDVVPGYIAGRTPAPVVVATPSAGSSATFNCSSSGATVTCNQNGGSLLPGQSVSVSITVSRDLQDGSFVNEATVRNNDQGDPVGSNNSASDTVVIDPIADVEMTGKTVTPDPVRAGEFATYVLSFRNNGPSTAAGVVLTDSFSFPPGDSGVTVSSVTSSASGSACSIGAGAVLTPAAPAFTCTIGSLANGETQSVTLIVRPNFQSGNASRVFGNTASVTTTTRESPSGGDNGNNSRSATLNVQPAEVDLLVNKTDGADPVLYGTSAFVNYRVRVTSGGPSYATAVRIAETMQAPAGRRVRFVCDVDTLNDTACSAVSLCSSANVTSTPGGTLSFSCDVPAGDATTGEGLGELATSQSKNVFLRFEFLDPPAASGDVFRNTAVVSSNEPDSFAGNNTEQEPTTVRQRLNLRVAKDANPSALTLNQPFIWTVTVTNDGPGTSQQSDLTDVLPSGAEITGPITWSRSATPASGTCTLNGTTFTCPLGVMPALSVGTISIPARITTFPAGGQLTNTASIDTTVGVIGGIDTNAGDNSAQHTVTVTRSSISGTVFEDRDRTGANAGTPQSAGTEPRLPGVTITLSGTDAYGNTITRTVTSGADGSYQFTDLPPSDATGYRITQTQPGGRLNGPSDPPSSGTGSPSAGGTYANAGSTGNSIFSGVVLGGAVDAVNYNFPEAPSASISGHVYVDSDLSGGRTTGDVPIAGATVRLLDATTGNEIATTTTGTDGSYAFLGLDPSKRYILEQPLPATPVGLANGPVTPGTVDGAACVSGCTSLPASTSNGADRITAIDLSGSSPGAGTNFDFGEIAGASITGRVFLDADDDGLVDPGEGGIPGVTLVLTGTDDLGRPVSLTVVTGADGRYSFTGLRPGTYSVSEPTQPPGTSDGRVSAGNLGGQGSTPRAGNSSIGQIVIGSGAAAVDYNFGELGDSPDLVVRKTHTPTRLTTDVEASYTITVRNIGQLATSGSYTVSDRLPTGITLAAAPTGTGWTCAGSAGASSFSCTSSTVVAAGTTASHTITARVAVGAAALNASPVINAVMVEGGGELPARGPSDAERAAFNGNPLALPTCTDPASANACQDAAEVQASASLSGTVWFDIGATDGLLDSGDRRLANWIVEVVDPATGTVVGTTRSGTDGRYSIDHLTPRMPLVVRFREPTTGIVFGSPVNGETSPGTPAPCAEQPAIQNATASSCVIAAPNTQLAVVLAPGANLAEQSLPVDPSGVVYDSSTRAPVAGAVVTLAPVGSCPGFDAAQHVINLGLGGYAVNGSAVSMTTGADGLYQFLIAPQAPASCTFGLTVAPPPAYSWISTEIPPQAGTLIPPGPAGSTYEVQPNPDAPTAPVGPATQYWLQLTSGSAVPGIVHNHIPLDPVANARIALTKTGDKRTVEVGDTMLYTITVRHVSGPGLAHATVRDRLPAGFTYIRGTARVNGQVILDPTGHPGPQLGFEVGALGVGGQVTLTYRVRIGVGSQEGDGINRAQAWACGTTAGCLGGALQPLAGTLPSNEARHRVQVTGGVFSREACVLGKVFVDCNGNHLQDPEELGIPGVRMYLEDGTFVVSDSEGKYSLCGLSPRSHVMKVDPLTLPRGSRLTTSSNRNLGDADSLWLDLKFGELHRADVIEGSCSNPLLEQVKARRAQGEVRSVETERQGAPALKFQSKPGAPAQGTDSANQPIVQPRTAPPAASGPSRHENDLPVPVLPMNRATTGGRDAR